MAMVFMLTLFSSLVSLPFVSKKNKSIILNTVEEESKSGSNSATEEHHSGEKCSVLYLDMAGFILQNIRLAITYPVITSIAILSSSHFEKMIQPPDINL
jgi:hypothetical protein